MIIKLSPLLYIVMVCMFLILFIFIADDGVSSFPFVPWEYQPLKSQLSPENGPFWDGIGRIRVNLKG